MNKIFKNIWNHFRGQVVCVSEKSSSHDHSSASESVDSTNETFIIAKTFVRTAISTAVLTAFMVGQPVQAAIDYTQWGQEEGVIQTPSDTNDKKLTIAGGNYGYVDQWIDWNNTPKHVVTISENGGLNMGVFGFSAIVPDKTIGSLGKTGKLRHWALVNHGFMVDTKEPVGGKAQVGSTNWIHKFANLADGRVDFFDLRSSEVLNNSQEFKVGILER